MTIIIHRHVHISVHGKPLLYSHLNKTCAHISSLCARVLYPASASNRRRCFYPPRTSPRESPRPAPWARFCRRAVQRRHSGKNGGKARTVRCALTVGQSRKRGVTGDPRPHTLPTARYSALYRRDNCTARSPAPPWRGPDFLGGQENRVQQAKRPGLLRPVFIWRGGSEKGCDDCQSTEHGKEC